MFLFLGFIGGRLSVEFRQIMLNGGKLLVEVFCFVIGVIGYVFFCNKLFNFALQRPVSRYLCNAVGFEISDGSIGYDEIIFVCGAVGGFLLICLLSLILVSHIPRLAVVDYPFLQFLFLGYFCFDGI